MIDLDDYIPLNKMHNVVFSTDEIDYVAYVEFPFVDIDFHDFILSDLQRFDFVFTYSNN